MFSAIDRYVARLIAVPLFSSLLLAAMLLVLDRMLRLFQFVATEGGPVSVVWRMLANLLPEYLSLGIPIGLLMGILWAFRKLAMNSELDALRSVGLSYGRLLRTPYIYAVVLAFVNLGIVGFIQPYARYAYEGLNFELRSGALGASIKVGEFTRFGKQMTIRIEQSENDGRDLSGIFVMAEAKDGKTLAVTAKTGTFMAVDDPDVIILRLHDGVLVHDAPDYDTPRILSFSSHDLPIPLPKSELFRGRGGKDRELTMPELFHLSQDDSVPQKVRNLSLSNFYFRMAEVAMMLLMPLLAVALAVPAKRSSSSLGVPLAIVMVVAYHKINEYAEGMGGLGRVDPFFALWIPFGLFAALIIWMFYTLAYVPGGQPIGGLERVSGKVVKFFKRLFVRNQPPLGEI